LSTSSSAHVGSIPILVPHWHKVLGPQLHKAEATNHEQVSPSTPIWLTPLREECGHLFVF